MKSIRLFTAAAIFAAVLPAAATAVHPATSYGKLPLTFERNEGQADPAVRFVSRGNGYSLFLTPSEAVLRLKGASEESAVIRWHAVGGNRNPRVTGESAVATKTNHFHGGDPSQWRTGVANYANVRYGSVYPGIDLVYHGNQRQVEYDFVVAPKGDPKQIRVAFQGADAVKIGADGELILHTAHGDLVQPRPIVYQELNGQRQPVDGRYALLAKNEVGFVVGRYDRTRTLVIDPVIVYSTYLGGSAVDEGLGMAVDAAGNAYITGLVESTTFPGVDGSSIQPSNGYDFDAFVTKINPAGTAIVYSTYLGGNGGNEYGMAIAVDASGNAYVAGGTNSTNFPGASGSAIQSTFGGNWRDGFATKINAAGNAITYSTYLGGSGDDIAWRIAADSSGNAYVVGMTGSTTFPGVSGGSIQSTNPSGGSFVTKINAAGTATIWSTFLGGGSASGLAVDGSGNVFVGGTTSSTTFPGVTGGSLQSTNAGNNDAFITKINAAGTAITWSTFLGGSGAEELYGLAIQGGNVYVTGSTDSTTFPGVGGGSIQSTNGGSGDAFVTKINSTGTAITWSTFLGGSAIDLPSGGIAVDASGNAYVAGATVSTTFTGVDGSSMQSSNGGGTADGFVTRINSGGTTIGYSTFLGDNGDDEIMDLALDGSGNAYVTGWTDSSAFPGVTGGSIQSTYGGGWVDGFVTKISGSGPAVILSVSPTSARAGDSITFTGTGFGATQGSGSVWLGSKAAGSIVSWSDTQVVATVASGAVTGSAQIFQHGAWVNYGAFTVQTPVITNVTPTTARAGDSITLTGTNFGASGTTAQVWLGNKIAGSIVSWSDTQVVATVASGAKTGTAQIQQGGVWYNYGAFNVITPVVSSLSPTSGPVGTQVTITGTGFGTTQGSGSVWLGTKTAGSIVSWSDTQVVATVASGSATGGTQVFQNGVWSNAVTFTVTP
jgi:hypothetical protein